MGDSERTENVRFFFTIGYKNLPLVNRYYLLPMADSVELIKIEKCRVSFKQST
ncbi:hypothetical protein FC19_GL001390 [Liquorilactobacillus aquaticus DSM 21051]|uniref:Uncharacterized protein n=1 Tax=Liquorilactobacillus aquaticus DSM 21051 TaxID=1423725 RepID=A0A0R2CW75_9LACO|nr:hypothetical protein FC19_GL001390 [Liquorilactobacillus aquaticus DSM 21051]